MFPSRFGRDRAPRRQQRSRYQRHLAKRPRQGTSSWASAVWDIPDQLDQIARLSPSSAKEALCWQFRLAPVCAACLAAPLKKVERTLSWRTPLTRLCRNCSTSASRHTDRQEVGGYRETAGRDRRLYSDASTRGQQSVHRRQAPIFDETGSLGTNLKIVISDGPKAATTLYKNEVGKKKEDPVAKCYCWWSDIAPKNLWQAVCKARSFPVD